MPLGHIYPMLCFDVLWRLCYATTSGLILGGNDRQWHQGLRTR